MTHRSPMNATHLLREYEAAVARCVRRDPRSIREFARLLGTTHPWLVRWLGGEGGISRGSLDMLAAIVGVRIENAEIVEPPTPEQETDHAR